MTDEELKIARAFVACARWQWLPGMRAVGRKGYPAAWFRVEEPLQKLGGVWRGAVPDVTDPATLGCILQLVQDAGGLIFKLSIRPMGDMLVVEWPNGRLDSFRGTFSRVLLQALQAAPEVQS